MVGCRDHSYGLVISQTNDNIPKNEKNHTALTSDFFRDIRALKENGMKIFRFTLPLCLLLLIITFISCSSESGADTPESRNIVVTIRNLEDNRAVHIYFETEQPSSGNLVNPQSSIEKTILAHRIGHIFSVYVDDAANPGGTALLTTNVEVTSTSYNSRTAELQWTGNDLLRIGW
jgi:hypothetical protein